MRKHDRQEQETYIAPIMAKFSCNEDMAYTILRSAKKSGEIESIKKMCGLKRRETNDGE